MTGSIKNNPSTSAAPKTPEFEMGDRVRVKVDIDYTDTPIPRGAVGSVGDVIVSPVSGKVGYVVSFPKYRQTPVLEGHELTAHPKSKAVSAARPKTARWREIA